MNLETWTNIDAYFTDLLHDHDPILDAVLADSTKAGLPEIQVSVPQGKWLHLMVQLSGAKRVLELGTLGAYSTIWIARALPSDGRLITLEAEPLHVQVSRQNLAHAGLSEKVDVMEGAALDTLQQLIEQNVEPFDFVFLDADKENYPNYLPGILQLMHTGSVLIADNVVRDGAVIEPDHTDSRVRGVRQFNQLVADNPAINATGIQTVGTKGYDGYLIGRIS
jgi:predicted O-methyltransferase YrrM